MALFGLTPEEARVLREAAGGELALAPEEDAEVAVAHSFADLPEETWRAMRRLRWVVSLAAGADHVPFAALPEGARVVSTHGPNATAIAEHAVALLMCAAKGVVRATEALRAGRFEQEAHVSRRIAGARAVVVGAGAIGCEILRLCRALGMRTTCVRASARPHPHADETVGPDALREALARADFALLALPLTRETRGIIAERELDAMPEDAVLVNVARGKLVDRDALARHLERRPRFAYATDVWWRYPREEEEWDEPLARRQNVIGTPHAAALVPGWRLEMVKEAARAVEAILAGRPPPGRAERPGDYAR